MRVPLITALSAGPGGLGFAAPCLDSGVHSVSSYVPSGPVYDVALHAAGRVPTLAARLHRTSGDILPRVYRAYTLRNFEDIPQVRALPEEVRRAIRVVGSVLPFRTNNHVVDDLIDWTRAPDDPMFILTFPQAGMLSERHFRQMAEAIDRGASPVEIQSVAEAIRRELNPHPAGQTKYAIRTETSSKAGGMQHKYDETVLYFPHRGQSCHAICSFCFRWPQLVGADDQRFAERDVSRLIEYLRRHPQVTDVLITGGDPMVMSARLLAQQIEPLIHADLPNLRSIRIGTKTLSYWPYRYSTDHDSGEIMDLFQRIVGAGKHLSIMAHVNHPRELQNDAARLAIAGIRGTGAQIRTQSPLLAHINDDPALWAEMWREQVRMGLVPYYMFVVRDTGAQEYFGVPLIKAWEIYRKACQGVSGLARTARGPVMSATPGKIEVTGVADVRGERVIGLRMLQGRNPDWVGRPFFARYDESALWIDDLRPAFDEKKFFFDEMIGVARE